MRWKLYEVGNALVPFHSSFHSRLWNVHNSSHFLATVFTVRKGDELLTFLKETSSFGLFSGLQWTPSQRRGQEFNSPSLHSRKVHKS